jgi:hypothetical protein
MPTGETNCLECPYANYLYQYTSADTFDNARGGVGEHYGNPKTVLMRKVASIEPGGTRPHKTKTACRQLQGDRLPVLIRPKRLTEL